MGCSVSRHPPKVEDQSCKALRNMESGSETNLQHTPPLNTTTNHHNATNGTKPEPVTVPYCSHSVSLGNGVSRTDDLPCGKALIIINKTQQIPSINMPVVLPNQTEDKNNYFNHSPYASPLPAGDKVRRSSEPIISTVSPVTRVTTRSKTPTSAEIKSKFTPFGERNRRLTLTQSQKDFFRLLDEKVAGGKDYNSEDDRSISSFQLFKPNTNNITTSPNHTENSGIHLTVRSQSVR